MVFLWFSHEIPQKTTSHRNTPGVIPRSLQLPQFTAAHGGDGGLGATTPFRGQTQKGQNVSGDGNVGVCVGFNVGNLDGILVNIVGINV